MNILLLGAGGCEHALAWKISQSPKLTRLFIAPGNAGTSLEGTNVDMAADDFERIGKFVLSNAIDMVVVGPEDPLVKGIVDYFLAHEALRHIPVIGPSALAARLEGSKDFAKAFMMRHSIPTAAYTTVTAGTLQEGMQVLESMKPPYVLKADGLAAGKGVLIIHELAEAQNELAQMLGGKFGDAGKTVVIEEFLSGIEVSVFVVTDGKSCVLLPEAKDYKRIGEGDTGPNTGGMGAISPVPFADKSFMKKVESRIILPTIRGLQSEKITYKGFIFFGLINCLGDPYVIEYNARLGDPETEAIIPRIQSDIVDLFEGVAAGTLQSKTITIDPRAVTTVMLVSGGYPGHYEKGKQIAGLDKVHGSMVFHAGTKQLGDAVVTNGGRVIAVSSYGYDFKESRALSFKNAGIVDFDKKYFRGDIGFDLANS